MTEILAFSLGYCVAILSFLLAYRLGRASKTTPPSAPWFGPNDPQWGSR